MDSVQGMMEVSPFKRLNSAGVLTSPFLLGEVVNATQEACARQEDVLEYLSHWQAYQEESCGSEDVRRQHELRHNPRLSEPTAGEFPSRGCKPIGSSALSLIHI